MQLLICFLQFLLTSRSIYCLQLGNYNSFEGVLYCRPHFDQLFKRTGSLDKSFEGTTGRNQNSKLYFLFLLVALSDVFLFTCIIFPGTPKIAKPEKPIDGEVFLELLMLYIKHVYLVPPMDLDH